MEFITVLLIAIGLAMDAFAVAVTNGITVPGFNKGDAAKQGLFFGGFQFLMPVIGWFLGSSVKNQIEAFDHWIAFVLLLLIGLNMILGSGKDGKENNAEAKRLTTGKLIVQAIATSIDAFAVGISLALLDINIIYASAIIGVVAFLFAFVGGALGKRLGGIFKQKTEIIGGVILILIGLKILIEHLFF